MRLVQKIKLFILFPIVTTLIAVPVMAASGIGEEIAKERLDRAVPSAHSIAKNTEDLLGKIEWAVKSIDAGAQISGELSQEDIEILGGYAVDLSGYRRQINKELSDFERELSERGLQAKIADVRTFKQIQDQQFDQLEAGINNLLNVSGRRFNAGIMNSGRGSKRLNSTDFNNINSLKNVFDARKRAKSRPAGANLPLVISTPTTPPQIDPVPANVVFSVTGAPSASDLKSTEIVAITPKIRALAARLEYSPIKMYEYVANRIEFEPYYGALQNAETTLLAGRGNDYDQATLLIALLRASGYPARYATSKVMLPVETALSLFRTRDLNMAASVMSALGHPEATRITDDGTAEGTTVGYGKTQVWVVAYVPYGNYRGSKADQSDMRWVSLDPSVKRHELQNGITLDLADSELTFDYTDYLSSIQSFSPAEVFRDQVRNYLKANMPQKATSDVPYKGSIKQQRLNVLPSSLPYTITSTPSTFYEISQQYTHQVKFDIKRESNNAVLLSFPYTSVAKLSDKSLTISFVAATAADQAVIDSYGGFDQVPASAILNVLPIVKIDGAIFMTGSIPVGYGVDLKIDMKWLDFAAGYTNQSAIPNERSTEVETVAGNLISVLLDFNQASNELINNRVSGFIEAQNSVTTAEKDNDYMMGEMLHIAGLRYSQMLREHLNIIEDMTQVRLYNHTMNVGTTSMNNRVSYTFGSLPFAVKNDGFLLDGKSGYLLAWNVGERTITQQQLTEVSKLAVYTYATLEHQVWEEITHVVSISSVKGIQLATENAVPLYNLMASDASKICLEWTFNSTTYCSNNPDDLNKHRRSPSSAGEAVKV